MTKTNLCRTPDREPGSVDTLVQTEPKCKATIGHSTNGAVPGRLGVRALHMVWQDLAFLHWPMDAALLAARLPERLRLDTFEGRAWLGITPFRMTKVRPAWMPSLPGVSTFPELNVRTYVVADGIPGIWFFSLDAGQRLAVVGARTLLNLPYHHARCSIETVDDGVRYATERLDGSGVRGRFSASYRATGTRYLSQPGHLDHWLTERYCLYGVSRRGSVFRLAVTHEHWPLQPAEVDIAENTLLEADELTRVQGLPLAHFARRVEVWGGLPTVHLMAGFE